MDMVTAPMDGTRILIKCQVDGGTEIHECFWDRFSSMSEMSWQLWCGNPRVRSTFYVQPLAWAPIPEELQEL